MLYTLTVFSLHQESVCFPWACTLAAPTWCVDRVTAIKVLRKHRMDVQTSYQGNCHYSNMTILIDGCRETRLKRPQVLTEKDKGNTVHEHSAVIIGNHDYSLKFATYERFLWIFFRILWTIVTQYVINGWYYLRRK